MHSENWLKSHPTESLFDRSLAIEVLMVTMTVLRGQFWVLAEDLVD